MQMCEGVALQVLHDEEHRASGLADIMERADVGMRQRRDALRFALEAGPAIGISGDVSRKDFNRDGALEAGVAGLVDFAHPPVADQAEDFVGAEPRPSDKGHRGFSVGVYA